MTRDQRSERQRVETRAAYKESRENRVFGARLASTSALATRGTATVAGDANCVVLTGTPTVFSTVYDVADAYGVFQEQVAPGALDQCLRSCDARLLLNHQGIALARVSAGTLTLVATKQALQMTARMDGRIDVANALALSIARGDTREMSIGFRVGDDSWNDDFTTRIITRIDELYDCSVVTYPANPVTNVELLEQDEPYADAGPTGDMNQGGNAGVPDMMDGTGSRSRHIEVDLALERLRRPIEPDHQRRSRRRPPRRVDIDAALAPSAGPSRSLVRGRRFTPSPRPRRLARRVCWFDLSCAPRPGPASDCLPDVGTGAPNRHLTGGHHLSDNWTDHAACRGVDLDLFFTDRHIAAGKAICADLPGRRRVPAEAMADSSLVGVWGGTTERERARLHRTRQGPRPKPRASRRRLLRAGRGRRRLHAEHLVRGNLGEYLDQVVRC